MRVDGVPTGPEPHQSSDFRQAGHGAAYLLGADARGLRDLGPARHDLVRAVLDEAHDRCPDTQDIPAVWACVDGGEYSLKLVRADHGVSPRFWWRELAESLGEIITSLVTQTQRQVQHQLQRLSDDVMPFRPEPMNFCGHMTSRRAVNGVCRECAGAHRGVCHSTHNLRHLDFKPLLRCPCGALFGGRAA
jgi:hypothetical protein